MKTATETPTVTITRPDHCAQSDASTFFDIAVMYVNKDVEALSDNGKISTLLHYVSMLTGIADEDVWCAAVEVARAEREENQSRWNISKGQTNGNRAVTITPCPTYERIRKTLRGRFG